MYIPHINVSTNVYVSLYVCIIQQMLLKKKLVMLSKIERKSEKLKVKMLSKIERKPEKLKASRIYHSTWRVLLFILL